MIKHTKVLMLASMLLFMLVSCKKDEAVPAKTIAALVTENANLSLLRVAVVRAGLVETLSGQGTFTVFAPDNTAFTAAGLGTEAAINAVPEATLRQILLYHVLAQEYTSGSIPSATTELNTAADARVYVTKNSNGVFVNGAAVTAADIDAQNGVVHVVNKVLMPPPGNLVQLAQANTNLSFLVAAVVRASQGTTNVAAVLSGAGPFTVFAPTNTAFQNAGFPTIESIQQADPNTLASILTYHVIAARVFSSDLTEGARPATLNGANVTITLTGGAKVKGNSNNTASNITSTNIIASNGVVHVIDAVLLP
ncbi:MAG TPA: beta-Ig-H3/fasciclin [Chitinophagaceae bacterium]|nr:beta-Ig-H3/fasciclin [Chitinophagaceae bacterium]|eukprot:TRINITY_DN21438_c0_g1_i1.p1 TRINITY_DN21438_c0_g1~~TRINITY_DN21438_c0_g1_i1.p1  ORF type:complete len:309 (+),score=18.42 TRINITY_DN21438_c0_g1_i1:277-1203(+)